MYSINSIAQLCRFYHSLIKLSILDPTASDEIDTTEMAHFTLRNSRFEDANALYRILVTGRF
jgi:CCR4-NOT transcription complex subunit 11